MDIFHDTIRWAGEVHLSEDERAMLWALTIPAGLVMGLIPFVWVFVFTGGLAIGSRKRPWWQRARAIYPLRRASGSTPALSTLPGVVLVFAGWKTESAAALLSGLGMAAVAWLTAAFLGQWLDCHLTDKPFSIKKSWAALAPVSLFYGAFVLIFAVTSILGGDAWNGRLLSAAVGGSAGLYVWSNLLLPPLLLKLTDDPAPSLVEAVAAAVAPGTLPPPVRVLRNDSVNACAMTKHGWIAFTRGAVHHLTASEITCIARHEIAHLSEPAQVIRRRQLVPLVWTPVLLLLPLVKSLGFFGGMLAAFLATRLLSGLFSRMTRRMEKRADSAGAGDDKELYARALARIYELNMVPAVIGLPGQSHPELYDRMLAAGVQPSFRRPENPWWILARLASLANFLSMLYIGMGWAVLLAVWRK